MGWGDRLIAGHLERQSFKGGGRKFLGALGFEKKPHVTTLSAVVWPEIAAHTTGFVDVAVVGVRESKFHLALAEPTAALAVGLEFLTSEIVAPDVVRLTIANHTAGPLTPGVFDWVVYRFARTGT